VSCGLALPGAHVPTLFAGSITLPPDAMAEERPTLTVNFSIRNFQASGLAVDKLSFKSISYKPFKNIRCVTKAGVYQVRC
jgi:hypothetical protein